jgi:nucleoside-diphosphate-sugar epimerase
MKVLVTGAGGFLGINTVRRLAESGHEVCALVRHEPGNGCWSGIKVDVVRGDITDRTAIQQAAAGMDAVVNLAGKLFAPGVPATVFEAVNVTGTRNILEVCVENGHIGKLVHCSTTGVLGETGPVMAREDSAYQPTNAYERTKMEGERLALQIGMDSGLPVTVIRPSMVYGPYDLHLLGLFKTIKYRLFRTIGSGCNHFHPVYISDFLDGLELALNSSRATGEIYHIASELPATVQEFTSTIASSIGTTVPHAPLTIPLAKFIGRAMETVPGVPKRMMPLSQSRVDFLLSDRTYSIAKAKEQLGYSPVVELSDGIMLATRWYRSNGYL